jgi:ParB family chromosome partitioning protein
MKAAAQSIEMIPVASIKIINPRARDKKRFAEIVDNIQRIGLKRPITVRKHGENQFEVVCGQGRLEAYMALGQTEIPAIVTTYDRKEAMLASLVENIARCRIRAVEQIQAIQWMQNHGNDPEAIARKTGLAEGYVKSILRLLKNGETRLLDAALHGRIPITIATRIAEAKDEDAQQILMAAYEAGEIKQKSVTAFRRIIQQRKFWGKDEANRSRDRKRRPSAEVFRNSYRQLAERQRVMIRKARSCEARLLALSAAFRTLTADEDFVTLLRAEKIGTIPKFLADRIKEVP